MFNKPIKIAWEYLYEYDSGKLVHQYSTDGFKDISYDYDVDGRLIRQITRIKSGKHVSIETIKYSRDFYRSGKVKREVRSINGHITNIHVYNENGQLIMTNNVGDNTMYAYEYDATGNRCRSKMLAVTDYILDVPKIKFDDITYVYDEFNIITIEHHESFDLHYEYDKRNRLISEKRMAANGIITNPIYYEYDDSDKLIKKIRNAPYAKYVEEYMYDNTGVLIKMTAYTVM